MTGEPRMIARGTDTVGSGMTLAIRILMLRRLALSIVPSRGHHTALGESMKRLQGGSKGCKHTMHLGRLRFGIRGRH